MVQAFNVWRRFNDIKNHLSEMADIVEFYDSHPYIQYRYLVLPTKTIIPDFELLFPSPALEQAAIEMGKSDAKISIAMGPGKQFKEFVNVRREMLSKMSRMPSS